MKQIIAGSDSQVDREATTESMAAIKAEPGPSLSDDEKREEPPEVAPSENSDISTVFRMSSVKQPAGSRALKIELRNVESQYEITLARSPLPPGPFLPVRT